MTLQQCYSALNGNYTSACSRLINDKLVSKFILKFLDDNSFNSLQNALKNNNYEDAFRAAHTLKGICSNLSFTGLFNSSSRLTEALRANNYDEAAELFKITEADYKQTISAINAYKTENNL